MRKTTSLSPTPCLHRVSSPRNVVQISPRARFWILLVVLLLVGFCFAVSSYTISILASRTLPLDWTVTGSLTVQGAFVCALRPLCQKSLWFVRGLFSWSSLFAVCACLLGAVSFASLSISVFLFLVGGVCASYVLFAFVTNPMTQAPPRRVWQWTCPQKEVLHRASWCSSPPPFPAPSAGCPPGVFKRQRTLAP